MSLSAIMSRITFNELRVGYTRRASSNPDRPESAKNALSVPGVAAETFPYFNIGYGIAPLAYTRTVGEDKILPDNLAFIAGRHRLKFGYEMVTQACSDKDTCLP